MHINNQKTSAFGLIEVMIASVILSISLLGVASLQSKAMYTVVESGRQETAHQMISQLANFALNANSANVSAMADQNIFFLGDFRDLAKCYDLTNTPGTGGCSQNKFYQTTVFEWKNMLSTMLPNGNGCTCLIPNFDTSNTTTAQPATMLLALNWKTMSGSYTTVASVIQIPAAVITSSIFTCQSAATSITSTIITTAPTIMNICQVGFV